MSDLVITQKNETIFEILLNRPDKRNAINLELYEQLGDAIGEAGRTDGIRVVILRGEGAAFSSGIDLGSFLEFSQKYGQGTHFYRPADRCDDGRFLGDRELYCCR
jgi:enoyl-CoA hydratase/carnithine racemase